MDRRGYDAANVVKYNETSKLLTKKVMGKGENYEICNPLEYLAEAFVGFAMSPNLHLPHLPHLDLIKLKFPAIKA